MLVRLALVLGVLLVGCGPRETQVKPIERNTALPPPSLAPPAR